MTADGGFLIADSGNHVVRKVSADGLITCIAGTTGTAGSGGDGGLATHAQFSWPFAVAVTGDGGLLIADKDNHVVRRVSAGGVITRVAGVTGTAGSGGDDSLATHAQLSWPFAVAVTARRRVPDRRHRQPGGAEGASHASGDISTGGGQPVTGRRLLR